MAALLQYLFLSAFCWMMCEGVMLYLMLVVVFSKISKKWWFFLLLGWGQSYTNTHIQCHYHIMVSSVYFLMPLMMVVCIAQVFLCSLSSLVLRHVLTTMEYVVTMESSHCEKFGHMTSIHITQYTGVQIMI